MTLEIEIRINGRFVAYANAGNISGCADISDYVVESRTEPSPLTGAPAFMHEKFVITFHERAQSVWALVAKVAVELARRENAAPTAAEIRALARDVIGADARAWLQQPAIGLGRAKPADLLKTAAGRRQLATFLRQIEYGVCV
jgi:hypothetical protein